MKTATTRYILKAAFFFLFCIFCKPAQAQDKTISTGTVTASNSGPKKHKIMLVPFESRMYLSEIDFQINKESKLSAKEIKSLMRDGMNEQLYKKLKSKMGVVDLLDDTVKTKKRPRGYLPVFELPISESS